MMMDTTTSYAYNVDTGLDPDTAGDLPFSYDSLYLASQDELRGIIFSIAHSAAPTRAGSPSTSDVEHVSQNTHLTDQNADIAAAQQTQEPDHNANIILTPKQIVYLKNYVRSVAPWLDMFDSHNTFGAHLPLLARDFPALLYAMLAISARQIERKTCPHTGSSDSLELYQESIRFLRPLLQVRNAKVIATCVMLCCMEMMSARGEDWQRHLEGCAALFNAFDIHGFSRGVLQAVFWCYARMGKTPTIYGDELMNEYRLIEEIDVCGAIISNGTQGPLLKPPRWLTSGYRHEDAHQLFIETRSPDMYANYAVYLCAKVCELLAEHTQCVELGQDNGCHGHVFKTRWLQLWHDLQRWYAERPAELLPVQTTKAAAASSFPHIFFPFWAAISSNQLYHTACILLLDIKPNTAKFESTSVTSPVWHARRVCGISLANKHLGCLNNAVQPLGVAGRFFTHAAEHEIIMKLLRDIEAASGWAACWKINELKAAWGYSVS